MSHCKRRLMWNISKNMIYTPYFFRRNRDLGTISVYGWYSPDSRGCISSSSICTKGTRRHSCRPRSYRWVPAAAAAGRRQRARLWARTVAEGVVDSKEGCLVVPIVFRSLSKVARPACRTELYVCQLLCTARTRCRKTRRAVGHLSLDTTTPSGTARCHGERSRREPSLCGPNAVWVGRCGTGGD